MVAPSTHLDLAGPAGRIEVAIDAPAGAVRGVAVLCHPHPLHGGTMEATRLEPQGLTFTVHLPSKGSP